MQLLTPIRPAYVISGVGVIGPYGTGGTVFKNKLNGCTWLGKNSGYAKTDRLYDFLSPNKLRRTDHFSQLALTAFYLALENAGLNVDDCGEDGLLVATGYGPVASTCGFKDTWFDNGSLGASPIMFTKSVHNQAASHISLQLGLKGPVATICQHNMPFQYALLTACLWLKEKKVRRVLVGGVDEYPPFLEYCRNRYLEEKKDSICLLADSNAAPGEGAAFFVVERAENNSGKILFEMPFFGNVGSTQDELPVLDAKCCLATGSGSTLDVWFKRAPVACNHHDFREFYGHFPSAAALDLAALTSLRDNYDRVSHLECSRNGQICHLQLTYP